MVGGTTNMLPILHTWILLKNSRGKHTYKSEWK